MGPKAGAVGIDFERRCFTNAADFQADGLAANGDQRQRRIVTRSD
jgi:hypothetical protein